MDTKDSKFLWSCKYTDKKSFSLKQDDIKEVTDAVEGPGGIGIDTMPAIVIRIGSPEYDMVVLRKDDFLRLVTEDIKYIEPTKHDARRERTKIPELLRDKES